MGECLARVRVWGSGQYCEVEQVGSDPRRYRNYLEVANLPPEVQTSLRGPPWPTWRIKFGEGRVQFLRMEELMGLDNTVFDEDGTPRFDELADRLIDKCELDLRTPDTFMFNGLSVEQWDEVKRLAHERINGRA